MPPKVKNGQQGLEASLWEAANRLRSNMDAAEYKHVVLGLIFLKYVSDVFGKHRDRLAAGALDPESDYFTPDEVDRAAMLEDRDEYTADGVFWIPEGHRWEDLRTAAKLPDIGTRIDAAMDAIEKENPTLKGVLPKKYARRELTPATLGGLIDTFSRDDLAAEEHADLDVLGRVFEYMVGQFASAEGKLGGEFYTPRSVVQLMVEMLEPFNGRVYDPACGSGGMFVQADRFVRAHGGVRNDIAVYGQEQNPTTWRLAKMNLALRGIDANLGPQWGDSFHNDLHPDLRADFVLANPPFNISDRAARNGCGTTPAGSTARRRPGTRTSRGSSTCFTTSPRPGRWQPSWRTAPCRRSSPARARFARTWSKPTWSNASSPCPRSCSTPPGSPSASGSSRRTRPTGRSSRERPQRNRKGEVLFIDARQMGTMVDRTHSELTDDDIAKIADTYHAWRGEPDLEPYADIPGFCASVTLADIAKHDHVLTPGRYVGAEEVEGDGEPLDEKIARLAQEIRDGFTQRAALQEQVLAALDGLVVNGDG